jgi:hypothetical protein
MESALIPVGSITSVNVGGRVSSCAKVSGLNKKPRLCGRGDLFQKAGCRAIVAEGFAFTTQSLNVADTVMNLDACLKGAVAQGWTTEEEASKWWDEAAARDERGVSLS